MCLLLSSGKEKRWKETKGKGQPSSKTTKTKKKPSGEGGKGGRTRFCLRTRFGGGGRRCPRTRAAIWLERAEQVGSSPLKLWLQVSGLYFGVQICFEKAQTVATTSTSNASQPTTHFLISFLVSSDAEILLLITDCEHTDCRQTRKSMFGTCT